MRTWWWWWRCCCGRISGFVLVRNTIASIAVCHCTAALYGMAGTRQPGNSSNFTALPFLLGSCPASVWWLPVSQLPGHAQHTSSCQLHKNPSSTHFRQLGTMHPSTAAHSMCRAPTHAPAAAPGLSYPLLLQSAGGPCILARTAVLCARCPCAWGQQPIQYSLNMVKPLLQLNFTVQ